MEIYVWGTGCGASELLEKGLGPDRIAAFIDSFPSQAYYQGRPVIGPEQLEVSRCGLLIVTTRHADAVAEKCRELQVSQERILFLKNNQVLADRNAGCICAREILGPELLERLLPAQHTVSTPAQLAGGLLPEEELRNDYVRLATLELLCRNLRQVPGAAAELGVYRGHFAKCINTLLPERKLYLFDSFEGFDAAAQANPAFQEAHANTTPEKVLALLPHPEQAVIKAGFFPASLDGLEETFCLVSLDVDFYQATLEGLAYFWPRLAPGGCLMLHDWGNPSLPGVKQALEDYRAHTGKPIPCVPLCDISGSLILCK